MYTIEENRGVRPTRRQRPEFKEVVQACRQPGVSIAAVALHYRLNANLLRRWIATYESRDTPAAHEPQMILPSPSFVALPLHTPVESAVPQHIVIEVRRGSATVTLRWPHTAAAECTNWLHGWLR